jgi:ParB family chromosome partitioning protein
MTETNFAALIGGLVEESGEPEGARLKDIPIGEIYEDPNNPRTAFDPREIEDLAASIRAHKLLQPITVRPKDDRGYMIRFGARRHRAAQLAGLDRISAIITTSDASESDLLAAQVIENDHREGLNAEEMAGAVGRLLALGLTQAQVAAKLGRSKEQVSMYAALVDLPPPLQQLASKLGVRTLYELATAWKRDAARTEALVAEKGEGITVSEARSFAAELKSPAKAQATPTTGKRASGEVAASPAAPGASGPTPEPEKGSLYEQTTDEPPSSPSAKSRERRTSVAGFDVKVGKRSGHLLLEAGPDPETVMISFDDGSVEPTPAASVRLVRARSH